MNNECPFNLIEEANREVHVEINLFNFLEAKNHE